MLLSESNQHPALALDVFYGKPRAPSIVPDGTAKRRQPTLCSDPANALESVTQALSFGV